MILEIEHRGQVVKRHGFCADVQPKVSMPTCISCSKQEPGVVELFKVVVETDCYDHYIFKVETGNP